MSLDAAFTMVDTFYRSLPSRHSASDRIFWMLCFSGCSCFSFELSSCFLWRWNKSWCCVWMNIVLGIEKDGIPGRLAWLQPTDELGPYRAVHLRFDTLQCASRSTRWKIHNCHPNKRKQFGKSPLGNTFRSITFCSAISTFVRNLYIGGCGRRSQCKVVLMEFHLQALYPNVRSSDPLFLPSWRLQDEESPSWDVRDKENIKFEANGDHIKTCHTSGPWTLVWVRISFMGFFPSNNAGTISFTVGPVCPEIDFNLHNSKLCKYRAISFDLCGFKLCRVLHCVFLELCGFQNLVEKNLSKNWSIMRFLLLMARWSQWSIIPGTRYEVPAWTESGVGSFILCILASLHCDLDGNSSLLSLSLSSELSRSLSVKCKLGTSFGFVFWVVLSSVQWNTQKHIENGLQGPFLFLYSEWNRAIWTFRSLLLLKVVFPFTFQLKHNSDFKLSGCTKLWEKPQFSNTELKFKFSIMSTWNKTLNFSS